MHAERNLRSGPPYFQLLVTAWTRPNSTIAAMPYKHLGSAPVDCANASSFIWQSNA